MWVSRLAMWVSRLPLLSRRAEPSRLLTAETAGLTSLRCDRAALGARLGPFERRTLRPGRVCFASILSPFLSHPAETWVQTLETQVMFVPVCVFSPSFNFRIPLFSSRTHSQAEAVSKCVLLCSSVALRPSVWPCACFQHVRVLTRTPAGQARIATV